MRAEAMQPGAQCTLTERGGAQARTWVIDACIGTGATCHVYDAHYLDARGREHHARIRECCPQGTDTHRGDGALVWADAAARGAAFAAFERAYDRQLALQNALAAGSVTVHVLDCLYEGGGTLYSAMDTDSGCPLDRLEGRTLADELTTAAALAHAVGIYHRLGYLHLDIKPANVLILENTLDTVKLFDVDSVTKKTELGSDPAAGRSFTRKWAAPEQLTGARGKLCEQTDLYAVGAVLFSRVMGRGVTSDDIGAQAQWEFSGPLFARADPGVKRLLDEIFRRTLAASPKQRYASADELEKALKEAAETAKNRPFLRTNIRTASMFVGRRQELNAVRKAFESGARLVFLSGIGGIGKSALAVQYAGENMGPGGRYDCAVFCDYKRLPSVRQCLLDIAIENCTPPADFDGRMALLRSLADRRTLLILDNFDTDVQADADFPLLAELGAEVLVTTREDNAEIAGGQLRQITVAGMPYPTLMRLFSRYSGQKYDTPEEKEALCRVFDAIGGHTLVAMLLAKQLTASGMTLADLQQKLFAQKEEVAYSKDGVFQRSTIPEALRWTFRMAQLSEAELQVLENLCVLNDVPMSKSDFRTWTGSSSLTVLNRLIRLRWVEYDAGKEQLRLHPLVELLVREDAPPTDENCRNMIDYVYQQAIDYDEDEEQWSVEPRVFWKTGLWLYDYYSTDWMGPLYLPMLFKGFVNDLLAYRRIDLIAFCEASFDLTVTPMDVFEGWRAFAAAASDSTMMTQRLELLRLYLACINMYGEMYTWENNDSAYDVLLAVRDGLVGEIMELMPQYFTSRDYMGEYQFLESLCDDSLCLTMPGKGPTTQLYRRAYALAKQVLCVFSGVSESAAANLTERYGFDADDVERFMALTYKIFSQGPVEGVLTGVALPPMKWDMEKLLAYEVPE